MRRTLAGRCSSGKPRGTRISKMRRDNGISLLFFLLLAVSLASCRGFVKEAFKTPKIKVIDVMLTSNPFDDPMRPWDALLSLEVNNRNDYPLKIAYVAYSAILGRETIAGGESREAIRLGASGITVVKVPISIRPESFLTASRDVLGARKLSYELNGSVGIDTSVVGVVRIPFSKTGRFDPVVFFKQKGFGFN